MRRPRSRRRGCAWRRLPGWWRASWLFPAQELAGQLRREQLHLDEHLDDPNAEALIQRPGAHPGRDVEQAVVSKQAVGHEGVDK